VHIFGENMFKFGTSKLPTSTKVMGQMNPQVAGSMVITKRAVFLCQWMHQRRLWNIKL